MIGYLALFAFSLWFSSRPQKRKNPFASDVARAPEPLVTDEKERIKVIKEGKYAPIIARLGGRCLGAHAGAS